MLTLWTDDEPRDGPLQMAVDEALLLTTPNPVLRLYRWNGPWVSLGCFGPIAQARSAFPGRPLVRRWTGGGLVDHTADWTYSLAVPKNDFLATLGTAASYRTIHSALATALRHSGLPATLAAAPAPGPAGLCFQQPVLADVLYAGRKIAGAAQRRNRHGLLHQGSLQGVVPPPNLGETLARCLRPSSGPPADLETVFTLARTLTREKYGTDAWLNRA